MIEMELGEFGPAAGVNSRRRRDHAGRRIDSVEFGALRVSLHQQSKQVTGTATDIEDSSWSTVGRLRQCCRPLGDLMVQPSQPTLLVARRSVVKGRDISTLGHDRSLPSGIWKSKRLLPPIGIQLRAPRRSYRRIGGHIDISKVSASLRMREDSLHTGTGCRARPEDLVGPVPTN